MAFQLDQVAPWGRSLDEYVRMFGLTDADLGRTIVGCGDGPASFNATMHTQGTSVVSVDPLYQFSAAEIRQRIHEIYPTMIQQLVANQAAYVWTTIRSPDDLGRIRMVAMTEFLADFEQGRQAGRYLPHELPGLPFGDGEFELALCSHFLFTYSDGNRMLGTAQEPELAGSRLRPVAPAGEGRLRHDVVEKDDFDTAWLKKYTGGWDGTNETKDRARTTCAIPGQGHPEHLGQRPDVGVLQTASDKAMSQNDAAIMDVLYVVGRDTVAFEAARTAVDIVCAGDSLTGWNNYGPVHYWPYPTYPQYLQESCVPLGLQVANGGIAGEISDNGPQQVGDYLDLFPNARFFIIGMGTNDLGTWPDTEAASRRIIGNLDRVVQTLMERGKRPILFNVPHVNERMFPPRMAREVHGKRDYHNPRLGAFCEEHGIPLADICSLLHDEHFGDELHPNGRGAKIIAEAVFQVLLK